MPNVIEHQPREHAVRCVRCFHTMTWNHDAICDNCKEVSDVRL